LARLLVPSIIGRMNVTFLGAAREVTGSCHLVRVAGSAVALDFGMFQGRRADSRAKNETIPFPLHELNAVVLSHAHIDHSGRLPMLARGDFDGPIFATPATHDLCAIMLGDSAHIQEKDAAYLASRKRPVEAPLYVMRDVGKLMSRMTCIPYDTAFDVAPGIRGTFVEAGHILGSASVVLECTESGVRRTLVFSADIGRWGLPIIRDPHPFQAEHTLGRRIVERRPMLKIYGEDIPLRARVEVLNGYSAHADRGELHRWINAVGGPSGRKFPVHLVHGEADAQDALAETLRNDGYEVTVPERGTTVTF
jgi:Cft2 family RNA processing exonuclease